MISSETTFPLQSIELKGLLLPVFSGEDKTEYESWEAAFTFVVDDARVPVNGKMLRLHNNLSRKAWRMVKDFGYSKNAYVREKEKLENKFGGERCIKLKI